MKRRQFIQIMFVGLCRLVVWANPSYPDKQDQHSQECQEGIMQPESGQIFYAFKLDIIAAANEQYPRRDEASMVELHNGECLLAYANHTGGGDNDLSDIVAVKVSPEGKRVGEEWTIVRAPEGGLNAMSPAMRWLPDGRLGMVYSYRISVKEASRQFVFSEDEGHTWSGPTIVGEGKYVTGCHDRFTILSSGRFIASMHCTDDWDRHYLHVRVSRSDDAGQSWSLSDKLELPYVGHKYGWKGAGIESGCIEPCVAERADGSLLMTIRTAMGTQFCSESLDAGETWTSPRSMEVISPQAPANLTRVPGSDDLLLIWTPDYDAKASLGGKRHTIVACISTDGGRSWPHSRRKALIHDPDRVVCYPSVLYKGNEVWITLRVTEGTGMRDGRTSTGLMRVPLEWF
ncbi:sialidase family protein [Candidatus Poribacteria bacterium]